MKTRMPSHWGLWLFGAIGVFGYVLRAIGWFSEIPGDLGDARFNSVVLEHLFLWTRGLTDGLWDPNFYYPFDNILAFSDNHFGSGIFYILPRYIGLDRETAFQVWFATGNILNMASAYFVLRKLGFSTFSAGVGAFVFAFALPVLPKEGHAQLVYRFASPLALLAVWRGFETANPVRIGMAALWIAWQFCCSIYVGLFLCMFLVTVIVGLALTSSPRWTVGTFRKFGGATSREWMGAAAIIALAISLMGSMLSVYYATGTDYGFSRKMQEITSLQPHLQSYFLADNSAIWTNISRTIGEGLQNRHEHQMFLGVGVLSLALAGTCAAWTQPDLRRLERACIVSLLLLGTLTLFLPTAGSMYGFVAKLPGVNSIRAVARIILIMVLPVSLLCALGTEMLLRRFSSGDRPISTGLIAMLVGLLAVVESLSFQSNTTPDADWRTRQAVLETKLPDALDANSVLYVTGEQGGTPLWFLIELDAVVVAQDRHIRTLNGYSGNLPPGYMGPAPCTTPKMRIAQARDHLREQVSTIDEVVSRTRTLALSQCEPGS